MDEKVLKCTTNFSRSQMWEGMTLAIVGLAVDSEGSPTGQIAVKVVVPNLKKFPSYVVGRICPMSQSAVTYYLGGEVGEKGGRSRSKSISFIPYNEDEVVS